MQLDKGVAQSRGAAEVREGTQLFLILFVFLTFDFCPLTSLPRPYPPASLDKIKRLSPACTAVRISPTNAWPFTLQANPGIS